MKLLKERQESQSGSYSFIHTKDLFGPCANSALPSNQNFIVTGTQKLKI